MGVVVSTYHAKVTDALHAGARKEFLNAGGKESDLIVLSSPGSFELPLLASALAARADIHAVVALGCVIRGETRHDRYINQAVTDALARLAVHTGKPVGYGLLTVENPRQAKERAGGRHGNKGEEAMRAALLALTELSRAAQ